MTGDPFFVTLDPRPVKDDPLFVKRDLPSLKFDAPPLKDDPLNVKPDPPSVRLHATKVSRNESPASLQL